MVVIQLLEKFQNNEPIGKDIDSKLGNEKYELFIGHFKIVAFLSEGAFGKVYKGVDLVSSRPVAIKLISIEEMMRRNKTEHIREKLRRYLQTEEILMKKCHSAFVVKLYETYQNSVCKILVLEYCRHGTLNSFIEKRGAIEEEDAIEILRQLILGLAELHRNNIIHRDLKPANILLHNGIFKIADFGFCKEIESEQVEQAGTVLGSRNTMAPEVKSSGVYGLKADIWSLGMIYFMMIYDKSLLIERHKAAQDMALHSGSFSFKTTTGEMLSEASSNFLKSTLQIESSLRMNWEQTLEHPIFKIRFQRMSSIYLPGMNNAFADLKERKDEVKDQQALNLKRQLIDFEKLKVSSEQLVSSSRKISEQELNWHLDIDLLNRQYLECRISEYIYYQLIEPIQSKHLLSSEVRFHTEFIFLLLNRCRENIIGAKNVVSSKYPEQVSKHFCEQVRELESIIADKFREAQVRLKSIEDKFMQIIHDKFSNLFNKNSFQEKQKFLTLFERDSFNKEEQIKFTCERYMVKVVNEIKGNKHDEAKMKRLVKSYKQINEIKLEDVENTTIQKRIEAILEDYD